MELATELVKQEKKEGKVALLKRYRPLSPQLVERYCRLSRRSENPKVSE
jgi:hypothetical protein